MNLRSKSIPEAFFIVQIPQTELNLYFISISKFPFLKDSYSKTGDEYLFTVSSLKKVIKKFLNMPLGKLVAKETSETTARIIALAELVKSLENAI